MNAVKKFVAGAALRVIPKAWLSAVSATWWGSSIVESYPGAWQSNVTVDRTAVSAYWAVFACITLIAKDISKLPARVMQRDKSRGIFVPTDLRLVLRKPNHYQTSLEFFFSWIASELFQGNTYVLKQRDENNFVVKLFVLDPYRVKPLVAQDGSVYYELKADNLSNLQEGVVVPASEIIHDRMYAIHHPLIGVSPIYACGVAAMQGLAIQDNSSKFFSNMSRPSGLLTAPGAISNDTAARLKAKWEENYSGGNIGRVAVLGDGLKYEAMTVSASDSQLIEQLKMTGEMIAACYHVPGYKIGVGPQPSVNNTAALNQQYYDQCLQYLVEKMEARLDEGLELEPPFEVWMDLSNLLRMDPVSRFDAHSKAIGGGWKSPNEARREEDMPPVAGGDTPYMQQQNYSLAALDRRDTQVTEEGGVDVQATAMNGAQVTSLQGLILAGALGQIPIESVRAAIAAAFPLLSASQIEGIIGPLKESKVEEPEPEPEPEVDDPDDPSSGDDEGESEEELKQLAEYLQRAFGAMPEVRDAGH